MTEIWRSVKYRPELVTGVYAGRLFSDGNVKVFEISKTTKTIRESYHHIDRFPPDEQAAIRANNTVHQVKISKVPT